MLHTQTVRDQDELPEFSILEFAARRSRYAVVIPVWNQGETILAQLARMSDCGCDVILADGDSSDGSTEPDRLMALGVRSLLVTKERGLGTALRMGLAYAMHEGYDGVVTVDGNGKDGVEAIPKFVERLDEGWDLVQGSRFLPDAFNENTPLDRVLAIRSCVVPLMRVGSRFRYTDPTNGFKGISRRVLVDSRVRPFRASLHSFSLQFYLNYRAPRLGFRTCELPVSRVYPSAGPTPTKIHGLRSRMKVFQELVRTVRGGYNPAEATA